MQNAAITGTLRGEDSTGMFQSVRGVMPTIVKLPYSGELFVQNKQAQSLFRRCDEPGVSIMHHRAATRGNVSPDNAHPFIHTLNKRHVVGVHNGTLTTGWTHHEGKSFDVDSDYIMHRICVDGASKAFASLDGSYACVWHEEDNKVRLITNGERSIYFGFIRKKNVMLLASEHGMLYWLAGRNGLELETLVAPEKDHIHTFDLGGELRAFTTEKVEKEVKKPFMLAGPGTSARYPAYSSGTKTTTPSGGAVKQHVSSIEELATLGLKVGDLVNFSIDGSPSLNATRVEGFVELDNDYIKAIIWQGNPNIIAAFAECDYAECRVVGTSRGITDGELILICAPPTSMLTSHDVVLPAVPASRNDGAEEFLDGPSGRKLSKERWLQLTESGCINCGDSVWPQDSGKCSWVNDDRDVLCPTCSKSLEKAV